MEVTVWYLSTCDTCRRILEQAGIDKSNARLIDIRTNPVSESDIGAFHRVTGSYKALINGRSMQFRNMNKKAKDLNEEEARNLLLQHYSFLKRPVIRIGEDLFVGNSRKNVEALTAKLDDTPGFSPV